MKPGEKLREIRGSLSQADFGAKYGIKDHSIGFIEKGKQTIPDELALALEKEYGIPFKWWKTGEGEMFIDESPEKAEVEEISRALQKLDIPPKSLRQILQAIQKEPELMSFAAKAVQNRDKTALERFYKLLGE